MTSVNVTDRVRKNGNEEDLFEIELLFTELEAQSKRTTEAQRAAAEAQALAEIAAGQRSLLAVKFLRFASRFDELLATEHNWMLPRKNSEGEILLDNPMTRKDALAIAKAQHKQITNHLDPSDIEGMFEEGSEG